MTWRCLKIKENYHVLTKQFHGNFHSKTLICWEIKSVFRDIKWCFNASWGLKGLKHYHTHVTCCEKIRSEGPTSILFCINVCRCCQIPFSHSHKEFTRDDGLVNQLNKRQCWTKQGQSTQQALTRGRPLLLQCWCNVRTTSHHIGLLSFVWGRSVWS